MKQPLRISEIIKNTLQGEGPFTGSPSIFVRTAICNLSCNWCDSKFSWELQNKNAWEEYSADDLFCLCKDLDTQILSCVLTGGEPLLQKKNIHFLKFLGFASSNFKNVIIETNGTKSLPILADNMWISCSPKLSNSLVDKKYRYFPKVLQTINDVKTSYFKFVVSDIKDLIEIQEDFSFIKKEKIWLMACVNNKEELDVLEPIVAQWCIQYGYNFSTRLHLRLGIS